MPFTALVSLCKSKKNEGFLLPSFSIELMEMNALGKTRIVHFAPEYQTFCKRLTTV